MFHIQFQTGFEVYIALMLVGLAAAALFELLRSRRQSWNLSEDQLCRCADCSFTFVVRRKETVARCPRCGVLCSVRARR